jgi:hypothetical protein
VKEFVLKASSYELKEKYKGLYIGWKNLHTKVIKEINEKIKQLEEEKISKTESYKEGRGRSRSRSRSTDIESLKSHSQINRYS